MLLMVVRALCAPLRLLFRNLLRLQMHSIDTRVGVREALTDEELARAYAGKTALVVGGTKGIGAAIVSTLAKAGAKVSVVGRSAAPREGISDAFAADLGTVAGCHKLVKDLQAAGTVYDVVIFTVGVWPDFSKPHTPDGIDKVVQLDLVARHIVLQGLAPKQLTSGAQVMNVLASCMLVPFMDRATLKGRVTGELRFARGNLFKALLTLGPLGDAYLQAAAARHPSLIFKGTFPGIVATDLPASTLPLWLVALFKLAMVPIASTDDETGRAHATILAAGTGGRRVTYWNHLLECRGTHPLAYDEDLGLWLWDHLEATAVRLGQNAGS